MSKLYELREVPSVVFPEPEYPYWDVLDSAQLRELLETLVDRIPQVYCLELDNGAELDLGLGGPIGCAYYWDGPYLIGAKANAITDDSVVDFILEDRLLSVRSDNLLNPGTVIDIALFFFEQGEFPKWISWERLKRQ